MRKNGEGSFFTCEMAARLRNIRTEKGLTLDQVAGRMGLEGSGSRSYLARLERGDVADPRISTLTLYLRACGAKFAEFYDRLTQVELVPIDIRPIERAVMKPEQKERLKYRVKREVRKYQDRTSYPLRGKGIAPEKQKAAATKLATYRVQVAVIETEVKKLISAANVSWDKAAGYLTIARRILGELRRGREIRSVRAAKYIRGNRLNPELVERIRQSVTERYRTLLG